MTTLVDVSIPAESFAFGRLFAENDVDGSARLTQLVPMGESFVPFFWLFDDGAFADRAVEMEAVASVDPVDSLDGRTLYRVEWDDEVDDLFAAIDRHDVVVLAGTGDASEWSFQLLAVDREAVSSFYETCRDGDVPLDVGRVRDLEGETHSPYDLTEKQRDTLLLAYETGYFEVPRQTSLEELSDELGISYQATARRLDRGMRRLVRHALVEDGGLAIEQPWLAE